MGASLLLLGSLSCSGGECGNKNMAIKGVVCMCVLGGVKEVEQREGEVRGEREGRGGSWGEGM